MYFGQQPSAPTLRSAVANIHRDRGWWYKTLVGGALLTIVVGWSIAEGYQLESIENCQRGFPTPLPRWSGLADKFLIGSFGLIVDFFFFAFPALLGAFGVLAIGLLLGIWTDGALRTAVTWFLAGCVGLYLILVWVSGAAVIAKLHFVSDGELSAALENKLVAAGLFSSARAVQAAARLQTLPFYAAALLVVFCGLTLPLNFWLQLVLVWLGMSVFFYARLVTIQVYVAAAAELERRSFDARRGR